MYQEPEDLPANSPWQRLTLPTHPSWRHPVLDVQQALWDEAFWSRDSDLDEAWAALDARVTAPAFCPVGRNGWVEVEPTPGVQVVPLSAIPGVKGCGKPGTEDLWGQFDYRTDVPLKIAKTVRGSASLREAVDRVGSWPVRLYEWNLGGGASLYSVQDGLHRLSVWQGWGLGWCTATVDGACALSSEPRQVWHTRDRLWTEWLLVWKHAHGDLSRDVLTPDLKQDSPWLLLPPQDAWAAAQGLLERERIWSDRGLSGENPVDVPWFMTGHDSFEQWWAWFEETAQPDLKRRMWLWAERKTGKGNSDWSTAYGKRVRGLSQDESCVSA